MARAKDAPADVGGGIDPYVQRSMLQGKQQAQNRLIAAMQESGAGRRAEKQESGATMRAGMQAGAQATAQRRTQAAQAEMADKRAAEKERARREDREFTKTMTEINNKVQAKESELDRQLQTAMHDENIGLTRETAARQLAWDKVRAILGERAQVRNTNLIVSMTKGMQNKEQAKEMTKTVMLGESDRFDEDKGKYKQAKESLEDAISNDKRMDGMIPRTPWDVYTGGKDVPVSTLGFVSPLAIGHRFYKEIKKVKEEGLADPMGVLQDLIIKREGKISVEDLSSANVHKLEKQIANEEIKTEDLNETFGALDAMLEVLDERRQSADKKSDAFTFWNNQHITISQFKRNLTKLEDSPTKIKGSETQTVGKRMIYALRTIRDGSLGNRVSRYKAASIDGDVDGFYDELSESIDPYELLSVTDEGMNEYDIEARNFVNESIYPLYMKNQPQTETDWGAD